jgi:hypothetical protein
MWWFLLLSCNPKPTEYVPPGVFFVSPEDGADGVSVDVDVVVGFDNDLDPSTAGDGALTLSPDVEGIVTWDEPSRTLRFDPTPLLAVSTIYTAQLNNVTTEDGQTIAPFSWSFTTADTSDVAVGATWTDGLDSATVTVENRGTLSRSYTLATTATLRDNEPENQQVHITESDSSPVLRSGHDLFDALFALAIQEVGENSVSAISDFAFDGGNPIDCECYETGAKWHYAWTRDTAYAADLGLAWVDPIRTRNTLKFKLSPLKTSLGGNAVEIVQDTGTGGSWPVSSDRVVWALGARRTLAFLDDPERTQFAAETLEALTNTISTDRLVAYDSDTGLYRGEQSFLDWREQTYPAWAADDLSHIASSQALSTNVGHLTTLRLASSLADTAGDASNAALWSDWADDLASTLETHLWDEKAQQFSTFLGTTMDPSPVGQYDLLGTSLAILEGVASPEHARAAMNNYPQTAFGPPVIWPQQPLTPIYHNRGIWPFVTAYGAKAARQTGNDEWVAGALDSLIRGAALNLSNMENLEFLTGQPWVEAGDESGPVVNSRRQLWSVAGYLAGVVDVLFGMETDGDAIRFAPFIPNDWRGELLASSTELTLHRFRWRGRELTVNLRLPNKQGSGALTGDSGWLTEADLEDGDVITLDLALSEPSGTLSLLEDTGDHTQIFAPKPPSWSDLFEQDGAAELRWESNGETGVTYEIWRNGELLDDGVTGNAFKDDSVDLDVVSPCYAVATVYTSGLQSHHSPPNCLWLQVDGLDPHQLINQGGSWSTANGRIHHMDWGAPDDSLTVYSYTARWTGPHWLQAQYSNGAGGNDTGITAAVKRLTVNDGTNVVAEGALVMPHTDGKWDQWQDSTVVAADLVAGVSYAIQLTDQPNMTYRDHFSLYTAGPGGGNDSYNSVDIAQLTVLTRGGVEGQATAPALTLGGSADVGSFDASVVPGAAYETTDAFALDWDDQWVYLAGQSTVFQNDWTPLIVYVDASTGSASAGQGLAYSNLTPELPFTPTHAVVLRNLSDDGNGPYNGLWAADGGWHQQLRFERDVTGFLSPDETTVSAVFPRALLGETQLRVVGHVVDATPSAEWRFTVPDTHEPWQESTTGYFELDLTANDHSAWVQQ